VSTRARMLAAVALFACAALPATAQEWPARTITMVVPFAAGGPADVVGRIMAAGLSVNLRQEVIVENIGGAGGMAGSARVAKAAPDGYQLGLGNLGTHAANQTFYKAPLYNAATDFAPVMLIAETPLLLLTRKDLPADDLGQFAAYTKAHQAQMQFGSGGPGSASHLACILLNAAIGVNVTHVPYRGAAPAIQDLIAGRIDYQCPDSPAAIALIQSKTLKALATFARERSPRLPDLPTAQEQGFSEFTASNWFGLFFPKGTPAAIVQKLNAAGAAALDMPAVRARMQDIGADIVPPERRSPAFLQTFVESEIKKWAGPIRASGVSGE